VIKSFLIVIIVALLITILFCNPTEDEIISSKKTERAVLPYVLYTSETGFMIGILGSMSLYNVFQDGNNWIILGTAQYTQKKQTAMNLLPIYETKDKTFQTNLDFGYKYWP